MQPEQTQAALAPPSQGYEHREMLVRLESAWNEIAESDLDIRTLLYKYADLGAEVIRHDPSIFEQTVTQLLEAASYMTADEGRDFLEHRVSTQTFTFQHRFSELVAPTNVDLSTTFAFHINESSLLLTVPHQVLVPPTVLNPSKVLDEYEPFNRKHVFFATDEIDRLAKYLVGHALLRSPSAQGAWLQPERETWQMNLAEAWACEPTGQLFSQHFMVAMFSPDYSNPHIEKSDHDIESPVRPTAESVTVLLVSEPVKVEFLQIPVTVLLPYQRDELEREASRHEMDTAREREYRKNPYEFSKQYALTRHAELAVKLTLLELWEANVAGLRSNPPRLPVDLNL